MSGHPVCAPIALSVAAGVFLLACARHEPPVSREAERAVIGAQAVRRHVETLASDVYEGRGAGYPGEEKAAAYIEAQFMEIGLVPAGDSAPDGRSFLQKFPFPPRGPEVPGQILTSRNVVGLLDGDDASRRDEIVVLGAHHDGQGLAGQADTDRYPAKDGPADDAIWNSADDNASSVAALIEVARSIARDRLRHHRTLLFVTFGAEEHALNGSVRFVAHPPVPLERLVAMVNLEKIGRAVDQDLAAAATGTCACWDAILAGANAATGFKVASAIAEVVPDTDHYPFAARGIPAIVLGTIHEEDTHRPSDSSDRIDYDRLAARARYARAVILDLANRPEPPRFAVGKGHDLGLVPVVASESELRVLDLPAGSRALKISAVIPGLRADRAGLRPGDVVFGINGRAMPKDADREALQQAADASAAGVRVSVARQGRRDVVDLPRGGA
ncbi:MAG TPA: M28 family peptidase [Candidatus Polarisedimenticolia bacterium]|nr:M28 family peptidase [Candidatus Polarisedimenticolia bacterium]